MLPATQTPKPMTGGQRGRQEEPGALCHQLLHGYSKGITKPYELLRPVKRAAPPAPASAVSSPTTADARPDHDWTRSPEQIDKIDNSPKRDLNPEPSPLPLTNSALHCRNMREGPDSDTQADAQCPDSSFVEVFSSSESWESTPQCKMRRPGRTRQDKDLVVRQPDGRGSGRMPTRETRSAVSTASARGDRRYGTLVR